MPYVSLRAEYLWQHAIALNTTLGRARLKETPEIIPLSLLPLEYAYKRRRRAVYLRTPW